MKEIIIKLFLIINFFKLTLSQCTPSISTVSEINPFDSDVLVQITGIFCTTNTDNVDVIFNVNNEVMGCYDVEINSDTTSLWCNYSIAASSTKQSTFNFNQFNSVLISGLPNVVHATKDELQANFNAVTPQPAIGISNYLYSNSSCPSGCQNNGICDIGNTCRCNEGYASFDCSIKVTNNTNLAEPKVSGTTNIYFLNYNENFDFSMSHILATTNTGIVSGQSQQVLVSDMYMVNYQNPFAAPNSISYMGYNNSNSWLTNFGYDIILGNAINDGTFTFLNYKGSYLPLSSTYANILINTTINSQFSSLPLNIFNSINGNGSFALVFKVNFGFTDLDDITWTQSDSNNSLSLVGRRTLAHITISDLYDFNGIRVPNHATLQVLSSTAARSLQQYSSSYLYLLLSFDQQSILSGNSTSLSGSYTHKLIINIYNLDNASKGIKGWQIALITIGSLLFLLIIIALIIVYLRRRKYHNHHHHRHHCHDDHHQVVVNQNEKTPLFK